MAMATMNQSSPALTVSMDVPHTQNTAPVLEFRCLYTPDLRRKQKRWQDGRLKFHTFNKRVMVYDDSSNFVGDTHWRKDYEFDEGEELELERGGILIEVGECIGKRDQDLTELVDKRVKDREERVAAKNASTPMRPQASFNPQTPAGSALLKPKSLNAVLGIPTGHYGKAVIPNLSPFEQRQSNRDENENERPAKRRKQDDTQSSKNGYAQALMGTKLTLASSRPPSSASIRYEPFRASIQRPPAGTIDLTGDDEPTRTDADKEERTATKANRKKAQKPPPARSGYASNLTGASLTLSTPSSVTTKRSHTGLGPNRKESNSADDTRSSSAVEPECLMDDEAPDERPTKKVQKQKEPAKKRAKTSLSDTPNATRSSSPPMAHHTTSFSKSTNQVTQGSFVNRTSAQPVSTLRIKSRPKKMMMLMQRPISRSPAVTESFTDSSEDTLSVPRSLQAPKPAPQDIVLSQATIQLDSVRARQEQRLQDCLNGKRPNLEPEDSSSSPADSGIDPRMIDNLLSRKSKQPKRVSPEASAERQPSSSHTDGERGGQVKETAQGRKLDQQRVDASSTGTVDVPVPSKTSKTVAHDVLNANHIPPGIQNPSHQLTSVAKLPPKSTILSSDTPSSITISPPPPETLPQLQEPHSHQPLLQSTIPSTASTSSMITRSSEDLAPDKIVESGVGKTGEKSTPQATSQSPPTSVNQSEQDLEVGRREKLPSVQELGPRQNTASLRKEVPDAAKKSTAPQPDSTTRDTTLAQIESPPTDPLNWTIIQQTETIPKVAAMGASVPILETRPGSSLPAHFSSAIQAATENFRSIIKSSASPPQQTVQQPPMVDQPSPSIAADEIHKPEPMLSEVAIKASPKPTPQMPERMDSEAGKGMTVGNTSNPTVLNSKSGQPKPKLMNPATRGPSVQMTASRTVNALVPTFNTPAMMPPPPRTLARPGRNLAQNEAGDGRMREPVGPVVPGGPWSRESFDLFGSWRPPGRANSVNG